MPNYTKLVISPETVRAAAAIPAIYGLKDSSGDRDYFRACKRAAAARPDFALLGGVEEILAELVGEGRTAAYAAGPICFRGCTCNSTRQPSAATANWSPGCRRS